MSLIRRSMRWTSSWMIDIRRRCWSGSCDPRHGFDGAAQAGQRVLDLVGDIGGEALDRVHALPQRRRHVAQRARQVADLVAAPAEVGDLVVPAMAAPDMVRRRRQLADRPGDGAGQIERQQHRHRQRHGEDLQDVEPDRADRGVDLGAAAATA